MTKKIKLLSKEMMRSRTLTNLNQMSQGRTLEAKTMVFYWIKWDIKFLGTSPPVGLYDLDMYNIAHEPKFKIDENKELIGNKPPFNSNAPRFRAPVQDVSLPFANNI